MLASIERASGCLPGRIYGGVRSGGRWEKGVSEESLTITGAISLTPGEPGKFVRNYTDGPPESGGD
jgi:hypothetical protein